MLLARGPGGGHSCQLPDGVAPRAGHDLRPREGSGTEVRL